jgi:hypothetical protein
MLIFSKDYDEESLLSVQEDIYDAINEAKRLKDIPWLGNTSDFSRGTFTIKLIWNEEE